MMADNCNAIQTVSFRITELRQREGVGVIRCVHTFETPQGSSDQVYQVYNLQFVGDHYVITDFMTSHSPYQGSNF